MAPFKALNHLRPIAWERVLHEHWLLFACDAFLRRAPDCEQRT